MTPRYKLFLKRLMDLILGLFILLAVFPLLVLIALFIKLDSGGPVFFVQKRLGKKGRVFPCFKFRTMFLGAEEDLTRLVERDPALKREWQANFKLKTDPRITRVGGFLRRTSLDELPQIINVLRGEMSLVGPRPRPLYELQGREKDRVFHAGLLVKPGITGLWQVSGRNKLDFEQRIIMDALYAGSWSPGLDIWLLLKTFGAVWRQKGAY